MWFETWNIWGLYLEARLTDKQQQVQVRWDKGSAEPAEGPTNSVEMG
jgi:hypothetical protein